MTNPGSGVALAHPSGNQFFRALALALRDRGLLAEACTCIDWKVGGLADRLVPARLSDELRRRSYSRDLGVAVRSHPLLEFARLGAGRTGIGWLTRHETGPLSVDSVYRDFDRWMAARVRRMEGVSAVYGYEDAAEFMFTEAAKRGIRRIYDLPIAYWETSRRLLEEEAARWPGWEPTLGGTRDSAGKCARKDEELLLADVIVCPSRFVAHSLPGDRISGRRVVVAPFGSPPAGPERTEPGARPLQVLFAGSMTQRKGLADLFKAIGILKRPDIELVVMGTPVVPMEFYRSIGVPFRHERSRPHGAVLELMEACDVLCLPSIVEGRALVIQEAMSRGIPAIVTPNSGVEDAVEDGVSGFVVPIRSPEILAERISWCAEHRGELFAMGRRARESSGRFTWRGYSDAILSGAGLGSAIPEGEDCAGESGS